MHASPPSPVRAPRSRPSLETLPPGTRFGRYELIRRLAALHRSGVRVIVLLALSDAGAPAYDHERATLLAELGIPAFACTPDAFPDLLAAALRDGDVVQAAARHDVVPVAPLARTTS